MRSKMFLGDNLEIMKKMPSNLVSLTYLDPPFNSKKDYNIYLEQTTNEKVNKQERAIEVAFEDTWKFDKNVYEKLFDRNGIGRAGDFLKFLYGCLGGSSLMGYICYMTPRLCEMRRILKEDGSIYLHCDPSASHYLKILMDGMFGAENFRNEIVWHYQPGTKGSKQFGQKHDIILLYSKSKNMMFNQQRQTTTNPNVYNKIDENGRRYCVNGQGNIYYMDDGRTCDDVWSWIVEPEFNSITSRNKERLGYPTQKPKKLLERIILASSNKGDVVFDPFSGSGTTLEVAKTLGRDFIGIDINGDAIILQKNRLEKELNLLPKRNYDLEDGPNDLNEAVRLAENGDKIRFDYEKWALYKLNFNSRTRPGTGPDGFSIFMTETASLLEGRDTNKIIGEVKSDKDITVKGIEQLTQYLGETGAMLGLLIGLYDNENIKKECRKQGNVIIDGNQYQKIQYISFETFFRDLKEFGNGEKSIRLPPRRNINIPNEIIMNLEPDIIEVYDKNKTTPLLFD